LLGWFFKKFLFPIDIAVATYGTDINATSEGLANFTGTEIPQTEGSGEKRNSLNARAFHRQ
jgi:hypothetical protein